MSDKPSIIYLKDYQPSEYLITTVDLVFQLNEDATLVTSTMQIKRNPAVESKTGNLFLNGSHLKLISVSLDGKNLAGADYLQTEDSLKLNNVPDAFELVIVTEIKPQENTALEGLYKSSGMYCTQCEAEGFRRITYFLDRPDVMAVYTTTIEAEKARYPVLLSNGNNIDSGETSDGRHWKKWHDPFLKPSYLFALVAGDLYCQEDEFTTCSGRKVTLQIFVEEANKTKCDHALASLKKAMKWDEETYGREYDLDIFMIVAVNDFNMGAMENKGLNVFNSACVLANPETATDADYSTIESIIGHEYFHNWSGNRVTCRDWFQLSLKEGFTVFRDQEFSSDMGSRSVKRISDVNVLRSSQFPQDAGPMAHPVRPESFIDISNFYTVTIYNKGAEVVRMIHNILGESQFRKGTDLYFERHDGQAVTTEDFVKAMEDATGVDLKQFRLWYSQAGTPELHVSSQHDPSTNRLTLNIKQTCPDTPGQTDKKPFHIPLAMGLITNNGEELPLKLLNEAEPRMHKVFDIKERDTELVFEDVSADTLPSLLRGFSAPVKVLYKYEKYDLRYLMSFDTDEFNRWEAGQRLCGMVVEELLEDIEANRPLGMYVGITEAFSNVLRDDSADKIFRAQATTVPNEIVLSENYKRINPDAIHQAREFICNTVATALEPTLVELYDKNHIDKSYKFIYEDEACRSLKNHSLGYLLRLNKPEFDHLAMTQYRSANSMTDKFAALNYFANSESDEKESVLKDFYAQWKHDHLVVDKWFSVQARSRSQDTFLRIKSLLNHEAFHIKNPNNVRAIIGSLAFGNPVVFHRKDGEGYELVADYIKQLNDLNPQMAARLANAFSNWKRFDEHRQSKIKTVLEDILAKDKLAKDVFEIVDKMLNN